MKSSELYCVIDKRNAPRVPHSNYADYYIMIRDFTDFNTAIKTLIHMQVKPREASRPFKKSKKSASETKWNEAAAAEHVDRQIKFKYSQLMNERTATVPGSVQHTRETFSMNDTNI